MRDSIAHRRWGGAGIVLALSCLALSACKIHSIEEDRALRERQSRDFNAHYVAAMWQKQALPALRERAAPLPALIGAIDADIDAAGKAHGRRTGEGAPWTFVAHGAGTIVAVDRASRRGALVVRVAGMSQPATLRIQIGPVVSGTAIRDALPFVTFNDFTDQLAFADVGNALTVEALKTVASRDGFHAGERVRFAGVFNMRAAGEPVVITPFAIAPAPDPVAAS
ncbi:MAG TPA: DUF2291 domain-containing protein [Sphingomonas sp.]|nr:DUF2291 domain-containing protein [Sphingomonas sp.]